MSSRSLQSYPIERVGDNNPEKSVRDFDAEIVFHGGKALSYRLLVGLIAVLGFLAERVLGELRQDILAKRELKDT